jgi:hypothetical protein
VLPDCITRSTALYAIFNPFRHKGFMDMGFSRRQANGQRRAQAERLAILLSEIAARQSQTPTARVAMLTRPANLPDHQRLPVSAFAAGGAEATTTLRPAAFHERVANSVATENQET